MFQLTQTVISPHDLQKTMAHPGAGALATFEGWVRNLNEGKAVKALAYEAFESLAHAEGERILQEARTQFDILDARCRHRLGELSIGEVAVWVGVSARHRREAFLACQFIIDEVKHRLPIWKKEFYENGDSGWVHCEHCAQAPHTSKEMAHAHR